MSGRLRHRSVASVDTNASAIAESTISIGQLAKFPEPPPSLPNTPTNSTFSGTTGPRSQVLLHSRRLPHPRTSFVSSNPSFNQLPAPIVTSKTSSHIVSAHDWHDGASSIDVDNANGHLLPNTLSTSFITSLLQENKFKRASSATSVALSGISDNTYSLAFRSQVSPPASQLSASSSPTSKPQASDGVAALRPISGTQVRDSFKATPRSSTTPDSDTFRSRDKPLEKNPYESSPVLKEGGSDAQIGFPSGDPMALKPLDASNLQRGSRMSIYSSKSTTFLSEISHRLSLRNFFVRKSRPLPPVPLFPNISLAHQHAYHELEMTSAFPDLIKRAGTLREMLDDGQHPNSPSGSLRMDHKGKNDSRMSQNGSSQSEHQKFHPRPQTGPHMKYRMYLAAGIAVVAIVAIVLGVVLGLRKRYQSNCMGGMIGSSCNINANCVCTSTGQCNGLAQGFVDLLPFLNSVFESKYTAASAYSSFWLMIGGSQGSNCASQAVLLDTGSSLDQSTFPNRTQWAQAALLWNALQTQDSVAALDLQKFVQGLPWKMLKGPDGPVNDAHLTSFSITASGYTFNFASQTVSQPTGSFVTLGQPPSSQIQKVGQNTLATLDRMYTYAQASSIQRQNALQKYWTSVLRQRADTLPIFKAALSVSPLMLPFNASSRAIRNLYPSSTSSPFPPPHSCFPDLDLALQRQINAFESSIYGLSSLTNQTQFNTTCYQDRPVYGVLDVLRLRLPFRDDMTDFVQQAVVLSHDVQSRLVLSVGKGFSGTINGTISLTSSQLDPRQYGTLNFFDHVVLQYLTSISDINVSNALIKFVLNSTTPSTPPNISSTLYRALTTLPVIEFAVFGDVTPSDFISTVSPFTTRSGALLFGSEDGAALRNWTIGSAHIPVVWTENATSPLVVRDASLGDNYVSQTWTAVALALNSQTPNIGLVNITTTLMETQSFSP